MEFNPGKRLILYGFFEREFPIKAHINMMSLFK